MSDDANRTEEPQGSEELPPMVEDAPPETSGTGNDEGPGETPLLPDPGSPGI